MAVGAVMREEPNGHRREKGTGGYRGLNEQF